MPRARKAGTYHHGDLRASLIEAGRRLVAARGAPAVTLRAVTRQAGVSHAAVYHHFADREAVLAAVGELGFAELDRAMEGAVAGLTTPLERYRALGVAYVRHAFEQPRLYGLMFGTELGDRRAHPGLAVAAAALFARIADAIRACQDEGVIAAGSPEAHTVFCWSAVHGLVSLAIEDQLAGLDAGRLTREQLTEIVIERIFTGLGAREAPRRGARQNSIVR